MKDKGLSKSVNNGPSKAEIAITGVFSSISFIGFVVLTVFTIKLWKY